MDFATGALMLFPAFLIGSAFGVMIVFVLAGGAVLQEKDKRAIGFSIAGSLAGVAVFLLTESLWPAVIGPFITCPALALAAALASKR